MQVAVEPAGVDLHRLRRIGREALRERLLDAGSRGTRDGPAPVTATRTPPSASARRTRRPARSATPGCGNFTYAAFFGTGNCTAVMISSARERGLVHALEEIVGGDLALVGAAPSRRGRAPRPDSRPPGSLLASEPPIVPMLRTCRSPMPSASAASAGIARLHVRRRRDVGVARHRADDERVAVLLDALQLGDARRGRRACRAARGAASSRRRGSGRRRAALPPDLREQRGGVGDRVGAS